jgi:hypothetical protein
MLYCWSDVLGVSKGIISFLIATLEGYSMIDQQELALKPKFSTCISSGWRGCLISIPIREHNQELEGDLRKSGRHRTFGTA